MIIKDKKTDYLVIISFALSFFMVMSGLGMYDSMLVSKERIADIEKYEVMLTIEKEEIESEKKAVDANEMILFFDSLPGELHTVFSPGRYIDPDIKNYLYYSYDDDLSYELESGRYPSRNNKDAHEIVISSRMIPYAEKNETGYEIDMYGEVYKVVGVLNDNLSDSVGMIAFYDHLGENAKSNIDLSVNEVLDGGGDVTLWYHNEKKEAKKNLSALTSYIEENGYSVIVSSAASKKGNSKTLTNVLTVGFRKMFYVLISVFCTVNCISVSYLWIKRRMKEYVIRRTFGYSLTRLFFHTTLRFLPLAAISAALSFILQLIFGHSFNMHSSNVLLVFELCIASVAVTLIIPFFVIAKIRPASGVKEL